MVFENLLNPIFSPLLRLDPLWGIILISVVLTFFITLVYKLVTDQTKMKALKQELKSIQKDMKSHKDNPEKMMEIQKGAMQKNLEYMKHSFKPMIFTMIPILIVFGWLNAHLAFEPILPEEEFSVTAQFKKDFSEDVTLINENLEFISDATITVENNVASWKLKGDAGDYFLELKYGDKSFVKELLISPDREYAKIEESYKDDNLKKIKINNDKLITMNLFGLRLSWIWTYILVSIISSLIIRKAMRVH